MALPQEAGISIQFRTGMKTASTTIESEGEIAPIKAMPLRLLQNSSQVAKKRQGTTSFVPLT
jgi:hypothetical protein